MTDQILPPSLQNVLASQQDQRAELLAERAQKSADMPLRFWNQHAHFTTPATGTPEKAITGLGPVPKLLTKFEITPEDIAEHTGAPVETLTAILNQESRFTPQVMVDVEDAVALNEESIIKGRAGAMRVFTEAEWGTTLRFYRPGGLGLSSCIEDVLNVLYAVGKDCAPEDYPIDGIVWPKIEHASEMTWVCDMLSSVEKELGLEVNQIKLQFLVESGYCLKQLEQICQACAPRLTAIIWGIADYAADANLPEITNNHPVCDWARFEIVNMAGAMNVPAIDNMTINYPTPVHRGSDLTSEQKVTNKKKILSALKSVYDDAMHGIHLGMGGKWVGHPLQLYMVMVAFRSTVSPEQVASDLSEVSAYSDSVDSGAGAVIIGEGQDGYMADRATDRHLRARLRKATALGMLDADKALSLDLISKEERAQLG